MSGYKPPPLGKTPAQQTHDWLKDPKNNPPPKIHSGPTPRAKPSEPLVKPGIAAGAIGITRRAVLPSKANKVIDKVLAPVKAGAIAGTVGGVAGNVIKAAAGANLISKMGSLARVGAFLAKWAGRLGTLLLPALVLDIKTGDVIEKKLKVIHSPGHELHMMPVNLRYQRIGAHDVNI